MNDAIRWGRVLVGGFLLELFLLVALTPLVLLMPSPFSTETPGPPSEYTLLFTLVAAGCFAGGLLAGWWVGRPLASRRALHGALAGAVATLIYLAIASIPPNTVAAVYAAYGPFWFLTANGLRIAGGAIGAAYLVRRHG